MIPGFPGGSVVKNPPTNAGDTSLIPGLGRSLEKEWQPTPVFLPVKRQGHRSLMGYNPPGHKRDGYNLATKHHHKVKIPEI